MIKDEDWRMALDEVDLPEPKPGKKIITFSLPEAEPAPVRKRPAKRAVSKKEEQEEVTLDFDQLNAEDYQALSHSPRRRARESALLLLFATMGGADRAAEEMILHDAGISGENADFARMLAHSAEENILQVDGLLTAYAHDWDVERFSAVDRAILRLAVTELLQDKAADKETHTIVINEAIELGKKFGSEESGSFINGMLDNIWLHEIRPADSKA